MKENIFNEHEYEIVVDCTGVGDGVVALMQKEFKVHMAVQYMAGNSEVEDTSYPYGSTIPMRVGKSRLINNTQNFLDEDIVEFYSYTNEFLFFEMDGITEKKSQMGFITFTTK